MNMVIINLRMLTSTLDIVQYGMLLITIQSDASIKNKDTTITKAYAWEFNDGIPLSVIIISSDEVAGGFTWPMVWTINKYTYYISIAFIEGDHIDQFQRLDSCTVRIWYINY